MKSNLIDVPVLLIFFARPEKTALVFEQIKLARPSKLYLHQDGARPGRMDDLQNINNCRSIVENIDWDCQVFTNYLTENKGCWPATYNSHKWFFSQEEYGIVLEDDCVPSQSFFPFCKELLVKYQHDERFNMICGMNHLGELKDNPHSYFFTTSGSIWGWASWKRVIDNWDENYTVLKDANALNILKNKLGASLYKIYLKTWENHFKTGEPHFESLMAISMFQNNSLNIVPTENMISNVGIGSNTTHAIDSIDKLPSGLRSVFNMKTNEIEFPIKHPKYIIEDIDYKKKIDRIMGVGHPFVNYYRLIESIFLRIIKGDIASIYKGFKRRIR